MTTVQGGPTDPPYTRLGGPTDPPFIAAGGPSPPPGSTHAIIQGLASDESLGIMLEASHRSAARPRLTAGYDQRSLDDSAPTHRDAVYRLAELTPGQRMLITSSSLIRQIGLQHGQDESRVAFGGASQMLAVPDSAALQSAVSAMRSRMAQGGGYLPQIMIEADFPYWPFFDALGINRSGIRGDSFIQPRFTTHAFARTCEVLEVVNAVVGAVIYRVKYHLRVRRPNVVDPTITPWIPVPRHSSFPSGHSTLAHACARVLAALTGASASELGAVATAIAVNRELAGLHTELDSAKGRELGEAMGDWLVQAARQAADADQAIWAGLCWTVSNEWAK